MKHRERVLLALEHRDAGPLPDADQLHARVCLPSAGANAPEGRLDHNPHGGGNTYELERALDEDMFSPRSVGPTATIRATVPTPTSGASAGGPAPTKRPSARALHGNNVASPGHRQGDRRLPSSRSHVGPNSTSRPRNSSTQHKDEYFIVGVTVTTIFETAWALRGLVAVDDRLRGRSRSGPSHPGHPLSELSQVFSRSSGEM